MLTKEILKEALSEFGIEKDSMLIVHSSLKALGKIDGGAETVISALGIMHTRLHESISISHLAQSVYMNEDSFIRRFHKVVGTTPYAYLKNLRLRTALYLRNSGMGLTEIAKEVGYSDASSLLHALKPYL